LSYSETSKLLAESRKTALFRVPRSSTLFQYSTMPPQRTPLRDVEGNRRLRGPEISPYQRREITGTQKAGQSPREIEVDTGYSRMAVRYTLASQQVRDAGRSLLRSGRPVKYDSWSRRRILLSLRNHPKMTYQQRREATGLEISDSYIYQLAISEGLSHWRAKERLELTPKVAALRLLWCKCRAH
jgi:hypothetical protein